MRKVVLLLLTCWAVCALADSKLVIVGLQGEEQPYVLAQLGRITFEDDVMYLYGKDGDLLGYTDIDRVGRLMFDERTAIGQPEADSFLYVCSDPAQQSLLVRNLQGGQTVRVFSMTGQLISQTPSADGEARVDVTGLANGTYLLQAGAQVVKFIKQ